MNKPTTFSIALEAALERTGVKRGHLARRVRVHPSTVSAWCSGGALPHVGRMPEIEYALRLDPGEREELRAAYQQTAAAVVGGGGSDE